MVTELMSVVDWSRAQFAMTAAYHWLFVPLTLGLSILCAVMETIYVRTGDAEWLRMTKFWMRLFAVNFAIGVATGLILEFEFGTNWSNYSHFVGDIFGAPLAVEGIMAFFLEATFFAVMFFGWGRVSRRFHLTATWLTAVGANLSALWILVANAWMQYPVGCTFNPDTVRYEMTSFFDVLFSPVAINKFSHTVTSSFVLSAVFVTGVSAWYLLRGRERTMAKRSIGIAAVFGLLFSLIAAFSGDRSGAVVAEVQPMKLAAMEALYDGSERAPLTVAGVLRPAAERETGDVFRFRADIPALLSVMSYRDADAYVAGINDLVDGDPEHGIMSVSEKMEHGRRAIGELARYRDALRRGDKVEAADVRRLFDPDTSEGAIFLDEYFAYLGYGYLASPEQSVPNVPVVFYAFRIMVGAGMLFIILFAAVLWFLRKGTLEYRRRLLRMMIWAVPLAYLASQAGWVVTEMGRQPWAIQNLMPVSVAVSDMSTASVVTAFFVFTALLAAELSIMFKQISIGPDKK